MVLTDYPISSLLNIMSLLKEILKLYVR